jgi:hypothetical protein
MAATVARGGGDVCDHGHVIWQQLCVIARRFHGIEVGATELTIAGAVIARVVDADTVAFGVAAIADREALVARAPAIYFITPRHASLEIVLAHLATLTDDEARDRIRAAWELAVPSTPEPVEAKPRGPRLFYLGYHTDGDKPERRKFRPIGRGTVAEWLVASWRAYEAGEAWGDRLPDGPRSTIEGGFENAEEENVRCSDDDAGARELACRRFGCEPHVFHSGGDDDEGVSWDFYIFDEVWATDPDSDTPHPDRGMRERSDDDPYRKLLAGKRKRRSLADRLRDQHHRLLAGLRLLLAVREVLDGGDRVDREAEVLVVGERALALVAGAGFLADRLLVRRDHGREVVRRRPGRPRDVHRIRDDVLGAQVTRALVRLEAGRRRRERAGGKDGDDDGDASDHARW